MTDSDNDQDSQYQIQNGEMQQILRHEDDSSDAALHESSEANDSNHDKPITDSHAAPLPIIVTAPHDKKQHSSHTPTTPSSPHLLHANYIAPDLPSRAPPSQFFPSSDPIPSSRPLRPEFHVNFISRITFQYLDRFIWKANKSLLDESSVHRPEAFDTATPNYDKLAKNLARHNNNLYLAIFRTYMPTMTFAYFFRFANDCLYYAGPYMLYALIVFVTETQEAAANGTPPPSIWIGIALSLGLLLVPIIQSLCIHKYFNTVARVFIHLNGALQCLIYRKALRLSAQSTQRFSAGEIVNLQSIDCEKVCNAMCYWSAFAVLVPMSLVISLVLTYTVIGWPIFAGVLTLFLLLPVNALIGRALGRLTTRVLEAKDSRAKIMSGVVQGIRILKMYATEYAFRDLILKARRWEYKKLRSYLLLIALQEFFISSIPMLTSLTTFSIYFVVGGELSPEKLFTALSLMTTMRLTIRIIPEYTMEMINLAVSLRRISAFLHASEIGDEMPVGEGVLEKTPSVEDIPLHDKLPLVPRTPADEEDEDIMDVVGSDQVPSTSSAPDLPSPASSHLTDDPILKPTSTIPTTPLFSTSAISFTDASFQWTPHDPAPALKHISLNILRGQLTSVIGPVGSGKSTLIHAIIGDVAQTTGSLNIQAPKRIAYCAQTPWIVNGTFRENVLMDEAWDEKKYNRVIEVCALEADLCALAAGSDTEIAASGQTLSGGQKARLSLARACYRDADIYLLDCPLSAVDIQVAAHIYQHCIRGFLRNKTVVLVTHNLHLLSDSDSIVIMDQGEIKIAGSYPRLMKENADFSHMIRSYIDDVAFENAKLEDPPAEPHHDASAITHDGLFVPHDLEDHSSQCTEAAVRSGTLTKKETLQRGFVKLAIYKRYIFGFSAPFLFMFLVCGLLSKTFETLQDAWMAQFKNAAGAGAGTVWTYLGIYTALAVLGAIFALLYGMSFFMGSLRSANKMHDRLVNRLLHAPVSFFDQTPSGSILNRCVNDQNQIDVTLPNHFFQVYVQTLLLVAVAGVIVWAFPLFLLFVIPIAVVFWVLQRLYRTVSRELARLFNNAKSPCYSNLTTSLEGASTIRAHEYTAEFCRKNDLLVTEMTSLHYDLALINRWVGFRMESMSAVIIFVAAIFSVLLRYSVSPAMVGLALTYSLSITRTLYRMVSYFSSMECSLVSVERIEEFSQVEQEAPFEYETPRAPNMWPSEGRIEFRNVYLKYRPTLDYALRNVNVTFEGGKTVGIVGRSGSGKSTMIQALFRAVELTKGEILIDGVDISQLGLHELRRQIGIIPQNPFIFEATVRFNIDPFNEHSDAEIWDALDKVGLKPMVQKFPLQLQEPLSDGGKNISSGQQQLFCIARALLRDCKILICDEATANVSHEDDQLIQRVLREVFRGKTMIVVAHRIHSIISDADNVLVMHQAKNVEFGAPKKLLKQRDSAFSKLVREMQE